MAQKMLPTIIPFKNKLSESIFPAATTALGQESAAAHGFPLTFSCQSVTLLLGLPQGQAVYSRGVLFYDSISVIEKYTIQKYK